MNLVLDILIILLLLYYSDQVIVVEIQEVVDGSGKEEKKFFQCFVLQIIEFNQVLVLLKFFEDVMIRCLLLVFRKLLEIFVDEIQLRLVNGVEKE